MDDLIKMEIEKGLTNIVNRFTGETKDKAIMIAADINTVLGQMIAEPERAGQHEANLKILYGNLSTVTAIEAKELRRTVATIVTGVLNKSLTMLVLSL